MPHPPFAVEAGEGGSSKRDGRRDIRVASVKERSSPVAHEASAGGERLVEGWLHPPLERGRTALPRVGEEAVDHHLELALDGRDVHHLTPAARLQVGDVPAEQIAVTV